MTALRQKLIKIWLETFDLIAFLVFVLWIILFIRFMIGAPYTVIGQSMMPTFESGDRIITEKISQNFWLLERGDIIVFVPPWKSIPYIKRIIGLPGETVKFIDHQTYICSDDTESSDIQAENGQYCFKLDESYLSEGKETIPQWEKTEFEVSNGFFVMGDNRGHTSDSLSCFGRKCYQGANYLVPQDYLIGKVLLRWFPSFTRF